MQCFTHKIVSCWAFKVFCVQDNVALMKFCLFKDPSIRFKDYWGKFKDFSRQFFQFPRTFPGVDAFSRTIQSPCKPWPYCWMLSLWASSDTIDREYLFSSHIQCTALAECLECLLWLNIPKLFFPMGMGGCTNYVPVKSKLQHPPPPRATPGHLYFLQNFCSNSPLPRPKSCSNAPSYSTGQR